MTIIAGRHIRVALGQQGTMDAFLILGILIGREIVLPHLRYIGVAACTEGRDGSLSGHPDVASRSRHRFLFGRGCRVAAVAIRACAAALGVDTLLPLGRHVRVFADQLAMTIETRVGACCLRVRYGRGNLQGRRGRSRRCRCLLRLVAALAHVVRAPSMVRGHPRCPANPFLVTR